MKGVDMKIMRIVSVLLVALLALGLVACNNSGPQEIKIGFLGPMTGDAASYGEKMSKAVKLALEERNAAKALDGITFVPVIEDSEGKQEKSKTAIEKLASIDKIVGLVGDVFSSGSLAIRDTVQAEKIVMISPSSSIKGLTEGYSYVFRTTPSDDLQAQVFGRYIAKELGIKKLAILYTKNDYSQALAEGVKAVFEAEGGQVVAMEAGAQGDKDFKTQLTTIKSANPEAIFLPSYVAEIAQQLEQIGQLGIKATILSADGFSDPKVLELAGKFAEGVIFSANPSVAASEKAAKFVATYTAKYEGLEPDDFAKNAYDGANIIVDAIIAAYNQASANDKRDLVISRELVQSAVAAVRDYDGVSGNVTFDVNGDPVKTMGIKVVKAGKFEQTGIFKVDNSQLVKVE